MSVALQAIAFISQAPGSYLYQALLLVVFILIAARAAAAGYHNLALPLFALAGLRVVALGLGLLTAGLPLYQLVIVPPFDRAVASLTVFGLTWALASPPAGRLTYGLALAALALAGAATVASWMLWADAVGGGALFYNGSLQDTLWLTAQLFLLAGGMLALLIRRPGAWPTAIGLLAVLFAAEGLHYLFPIANADFPGTVRLAELIVWPLAAALLLRRLRPKPASPALGTSPVGAPALTAPDLTLSRFAAFTAEAAPAAAPAALPARPSLQDQLEAANRRNAQLREVVQQTRHSLQTAQAALAENEARLARATLALQEYLARQQEQPPPENYSLKASLTAREREAVRQVEANQRLLAEREAALAGLTLQVAAGQTGLSEAQAVGQQAQAQLAEREAALAELTRQVSLHRAAQSEARQAGEQANAQLAEREAVLAELTRQVSASQEALSQARQAGEHAHAQLAERESALAELTHQAGLSQAALLEAKQAGVRAQAQLAAREAALTELTHQVGAGQAALSEAERVGRQAHARLAEREAALAELTRQVNASQAALVEAQSAGQQAQTELAAHGERLNALQKQLAQKDLLVSELRLQLKRRAPEPAPKNEAAPSAAARPARNGADGQAAGKPTTRATAGNGSNGHAGPGETQPAGGSQPADRRPRPATAPLRPDLPPAIASQICPRLGLLSDPETRHAFASDMNRCYALPAPTEVSFNQQDKLCLGAGHMRCPVLTGQLAHPAVPIDTADAPIAPAATANRFSQRVARLFRRAP